MRTSINAGRDHGLLQYGAMRRKAGVVDPRRKLSLRSQGRASQGGSPCPYLREMKSSIHSRSFS
jgi:hypothetical protein